MSEQKKLKDEFNDMNPLFETKRYRVITDGNNWILQKKAKRKDKNKNVKITWGSNKFYSTLKCLLKSLNEKKIFDCYNKLEELMEYKKELDSILDRIDNVLIKKGLPVIFQEKIIEKTTRIFIKPDKRRNDGGKEVNREVEEVVIKDDSKKDSKKKTKKDQTIDQTNLW